jgi:hypothetical protein
MLMYRGQILKQEGNVTYVCFNPEKVLHEKEQNDLFEGNLAIAEE